MEGYIKKVFLLESNNFIVQLLRYSIVGGIAAVADISIFTLAANLFNINHIAANTLSFLFGLLINYLLSRRWVFNKKEQEFGRDFVLFTVIGIIGLLLSNVIIFLLVDLRIMYSLLNFLNDELIKTSSKISATIIVLFWNFIARKKIVFKYARR